ncbi:HNH endonuclease [Actinosynnema sp.]|uniref:HNH endonuclease n=1 Tax=Actinosynnema sp. TaxID=1872144 RepID=UPI003F85E515
MGYADVGRAEVLRAIAECDRLGAEEFRKRYGFGQARRFVLVYEGGEYDSKAVVGVAHGFLAGREPLRASDFSGGQATVTRLLAGLGFTVVDRAQVPAPTADAEKAVVWERGRVLEPAPRQERTTSAVQRLRYVAALVKAIHEDRCQFCGTRLDLGYGHFSNAAHIRALGAPHHGPDHTDNVLCLCPNCHAQFDARALYVDEDDNVRHVNAGQPLGPLRRDPRHRIAAEHLAYHRSLPVDPARAQALADDRA